MMRRLWSLAAMGLMCVSAWGQTRQGVVAQLEVRGDLDSQAMADQIDAWFARRDANREVLAVVLVDCPRMRADLLLRTLERIEACRVPVAVYADRGQAVAPGVVAMMLAADHAAVGRQVRVAGDQDWSLPWLCEEGESGWRGRYEALCTRLLARRSQSELLLDVLTRPLGSVFVESAAGGATLVRAGNDAEARAIVTRTDDEHWSVNLDRETLIILHVADEADSIGQVLRLGGVRAFRRDRTVVRSRLGQVVEEAGRIREQLRVRLVNLERSLNEARRARPNERGELIATLRSQVEESERLTKRLIELVRLNPELTRTAPAWVSGLSEDPKEHRRQWSRELAELGESVDELRVELEAIDGP
ncbi:MAG: hypothetical protein Kow0022_11530 [Phycisphaerales bacterium]